MLKSVLAGLLSFWRLYGKIVFLPYSCFRDNLYFLVPGLVLIFKDSSITFSNLSVAESPAF